MAHFYPEIHLARLKEVIGRLAKEFIKEHVALDAVGAVTKEPVSFAERSALTYRPMREEEVWGTTWDCGWLHLTGVVPACWRGEHVVLQIDVNGESLIYDNEGNPLMGLTNGSVFVCNAHKDIFHFLPVCQGGEEIDFWLEMGCNELFGVRRAYDPDWVEKPERVHGHHNGVLQKLRVCSFDYDKWQLWLDLTVLQDLIEMLRDGTARKLHVLRTCSKALDVLPRQGSAAARAVLRPLFAVPTDPATIDVYGIGHAHIDTAWLWPTRETIRKCGRTFASQIALIENYPEYCFGASQAQLYAYTKKYYPSLYSKIKKAVAAGRWEVQGGMWVEADCNLIGGESMVRQLVHGKNFFRDEFGVDVKNLWLPDVFGYSGNLPQILRRAGVDYFLTQKLSWNRYNKFPHNTFIWRGIDGSDVLAHFPPTDTYNATVMPQELFKSEWNNSEAGLVQEALCLFGIGNGGGGPREEFIERGRRLQELNGAPRFHFGFAQPVLEKMATYRDELATWVGELYFELHRGTLTTQAATKRLNRRAEEALRATEALCAAAGVAEYPAAILDEAWKSVLVNQFHDIIPGSSIKRVYVETEAQLQGVITECRALAAAAAGRLMRRTDGAVALFNTSSTEFTGVVELPAGWGGVLESSAVLATQSEGERKLARVTVPAGGFATLKKTSMSPVATCTVTTAPFVLENAGVRYVFDENLRLLSAYDKEAGREVICSDELGNRLELFDDHPPQYDAWDIEEYYQRMLLDTARACGAIEKIDGPARQGLRATLQVGASQLEQTVWLEPSGKRLDFVTTVDWREKHKILRVAFPTTIVAPEAKFEIQYGHVSRATHNNTKWQYAQFEVAGHRWADLSERDYGVALLNDSKYGYRVKGGSLELSLLRAATDPDPVADLGEQSFVYSLLPHIGDLAASDVWQQAAALNQGVEMLAGFDAGELALPVAISGAGLELAVLKRAEKSEQLVIRVVERRGLATTGLITLRDTTQRLVETDLLEWHDGQPSATAQLEVAFKPFEIRTWKIVSA